MSFHLKFLLKDEYNHRKSTNTKNCEKLLGVFFQSQIANICKKAAHKLNAISETTPYMDFNKKKK